MEDMTIYTSPRTSQVFTNEVSNLLAEKYNSETKKFICNNMYNSKYYDLDIITIKGYAHVVIPHKKLLQLLRRVEIKRNETSIKQALYSLFTNCICIKCVY